MKELFIFDFDGTLYNGDSMIDFAKFVSLKNYFFSSVLIFMLFPAVFLKLINRNKLKLIFLKLNFKGYKKHELELKGQEFFELKKKKLFTSALEYIQNLDKVKNSLAIVSGSSRTWLQPFADFLQMDLICTELDFDDIVFKGKLAGSNIVGAEKNRAIAQRFNLNEFSKISAFGNSKSDKEMCLISTDYFHKKFTK